ncbi:hypothetical protein [Neobacillus cucumis]|nr:hypothetical protein [Neobacillus cucumis]
MPTMVNLLVVDVPPSEPAIWLLSGLPNILKKLHLLMNTKKKY